MNKTIITMISIIVVISAIIIAFTIYKPKDKEESNSKTIQLSEEKILDDCTDEYEEMILQANSKDQEKISPNAFIILKTEYKKCGHVTSKYLEIPEDLVNKTESDLKEKYKDWEVEKFSDTEIILTTKKDGECGEHYLVKNDGGKVTVYEILENGTEKQYEITGISTEYLTETDRVNMQNGIRIYGKQNLNQLIEDFE